MQFTEGKAGRAIDHCTNILPPYKGYKLALSTLYERFGNSQIITSAFKNKLFNHPTLRDFDKEALYDYSSILRKCFETIQSIGNVAELNNTLSSCLRNWHFTILGIDIMPKFHTRFNELQRSKTL